MKYSKPNWLAVALFRRDWLLWTKRFYRPGYLNRTWRKHVKQGI